MTCLVFSTSLHSNMCRSVKITRFFAVLGCTVYPKKYAHGFVVLCFVVVMQSFIMNSHEVFIHIHQGCFAGTGAIVRLPQCQWSKADGYGKTSQCKTTTKHSRAKTVCIFLGIYCIYSSVFQLYDYLQTCFKSKSLCSKLIFLLIKYLNLIWYDNSALHLLLPVMSHIFYVSSEKSNQLDSM